MSNLIGYVGKTDLNNPRIIENYLYLDILQLIKPRYEIIDLLKYPDKLNMVKFIFIGGGDLVILHKSSRNYWNPLFLTKKIIVYSVSLDSENYYLSGKKYYHRYLTEFLNHKNVVSIYTRDVLTESFLIKKLEIDKKKVFHTTDIISTLQFNFNVILEKKDIAVIIKFSNKTDYTNLFNFIKKLSESGRKIDLIYFYDLDYKKLKEKFKKNLELFGEITFCSRYNWRTIIPKYTTILSMSYYGVLIAKIFGIHTISIGKDTQFKFTLFPNNIWIENKDFIDKSVKLLDSKLKINLDNNLDNNLGKLINLNSKLVITIFGEKSISKYGGTERNARLIRQYCDRGYLVIHLYISSHHEYINYDDPNFIQRSIHDDIEIRIENLIRLSQFQVYEVAFRKYQKYFDYSLDVGIPIIYEVTNNWNSKLIKKVACTVDVEKKFIKKADISVASSKFLNDRFVKIREDIAYIPNACDSKVFIRDKKYRLNHPRLTTMSYILYYGDLNENIFDWNSVLYCARNNPEIVILVLGNININDVLPNNITNIADFKIDDLPTYLYHCKVAILPYKINSLTQSKSPYQLYDYLYFKKPIISSGLLEVESYFKDIVNIYYNKKELSSLVTEIFNTNKIFIDYPSLNLIWDDRVDMQFSLLNKYASRNQYMQ